MIVEFVVFVKFVTFVVPLSQVHSLKCQPQAKFLQIHHFLQNLLFLSNSLLPSTNLILSNVNHGEISSNSFYNWSLLCYPSAVSTSFSQMLTFGEISLNLSFSFNLLLLWYPSLELMFSNVALWQNFVEFVIFILFFAFVVPLSQADSLKCRPLAKFHQIRHFRRCVHFWTYLILSITCQQCDISLQGVLV